MWNPARIRIQTDLEVEPIVRACTGGLIRLYSVQADTIVIITRRMMRSETGPGQVAWFTFFIICLASCHRPRYDHPERSQDVQWLLILMKQYVLFRVQGRVPSNPSSTWSDLIISSTRIKLGLVGTRPSIRNIVTLLESHQDEFVLGQFRCLSYTHIYTYTNLTLYCLF